MTGRPWLGVSIVIGSAAALILLWLFAVYSMHNGVRDPLEWLAPSVFVCVCVFGSASAYWAATRQQLITKTTLRMTIGVCLIVAMMFLVETLFLAVRFRTHSIQGLLDLAYFEATMALILAPFATAPLAVAWNRHR